MGFKFTQLTGARRSFSLDGASAPLGRPRKDPVVRDGIEARQAVVYYPGNDVQPTRHLFGTKYMPWEIKGYLRDRNLGVGGAKAKCEEIKRFVREQQLCAVTWDDVVSIVGLITKFDPGRESAGEIEWKMTIDVDGDAFADRKVQPVAPPSPRTFASQMAAYLRGLEAQVKSVSALKGSIFDLIDSAVSVLTTAAGQLQGIADGVSSFEKATLSQLNRLSGIVSTVRTASFTLRESLASVKPDVALWQQRASNNVELWAAQTSIEDYLRRVAASGAELDRHARAAAAGKIKTSYVVAQGDTWESISVMFYGSPDRAPDLQIANDQIGGSPKAGAEINIPV